MMLPKNGRRRKRSDIVGDLDRAFSQYARLLRAGPNGMVRCITCPTVGHWREFDAGHYMPRRHMVTRWDPQNVWPQCPACNRYADGNHERFKAAIDRMEGQGTAASLEYAVLTTPYTGHNRHELEAILRHVLGKIRLLKRRKGG